MLSRHIELRLEDLLAMFGFYVKLKQISMHLKLSFCLTILNMTAKFILIVTIHT